MRRQRDQGGVPHEVPMKQAMTTKGARRAPARAVSPLSSLVQRGQAQARGSSKGTHFGATRPRPTPRQGGSHCGSQAGVTTRTFGRGRPTLVRISVPDVPLQNGQLLAPFPLKYLGRGPGPLPINRTSHPPGRRRRKRRHLINPVEQVEIEREREGRSNSP